MRNFLQHTYQHAAPLKLASFWLLEKEVDKHGFGAEQAT